MANEVDFAFQGDVINLGSLTHMLTGRVLKALSDGKVDIYAVGAAFWLGARVPIRSSLADTVHAHVAQRRGYQSVLSKALSIGWGHSTPVVEMTRTRAGTNALLLVGALGTGATPFQAAQCLSELLAVFGISLERLPSVDVLKELVAYLTPFVYDLGFSKVLQHITDVVEGSLEAEILSQSKGDRDRKPDRQPLWELRHLGSASALAGAIKQLLHTSQNRQEHYMILEMRGSWLPAFASHLLGMSVELRCNGKLLWACGGDKGGVVFQLGTHPMEKFSIQPSDKPQILIASPETINDDTVLAIDYLIGDAVEGILAKRPQLDSDMIDSVHAAIRRMSKQMLASLIITPDRSWATGLPRPYRTTGEFNNAQSLEEVLGVLCIKLAETIGTIGKKLARTTANVDIEIDTEIISITGETSISVFAVACIVMLILVVFFFFILITITVTSCAPIAMLSRLRKHKGTVVWFNKSRDFINCGFEPVAIAKIGRATDVAAKL